MIITFGLHVGAWHGPGEKARLAEPVLGRPALLGLLETHLGLTAPPVTAAARVAAYLVALRQAANPNRFYTGSLGVDEIGTAARLLDWRDEWMLAGWDGKARAGWTGRVADMAAVEGFARMRVPAGEGERLAAVSQRLKVRRTPIERVVLLDPLAAWPARWQDVLLQLGAVEARVPAPQAEGDLGCLQAGCLAAVAQGKLPQLGPLADDGSVTVLRALTCETAEHWLADRCRSHPQASRLLVSEDQGSSVDDTLRVHGLPACGFDDPSTLRPGVQALALALEMLWDPVEPQRVLDFLTHPINPIRSKALRAELAAAFAGQPGIGGGAWAEAREAMTSRWPDEAQETLAAVAFWLEAPRWGRQAGAPLQEVIQRVERLRERSASMSATYVEQANTDLAQPWRAALNHCCNVLEALQMLQAQEVKTISARALQQIVSQAAGAGAAGVAVAEAGCLASASTPAACAVECADEVVWWMPARPQLPRALPWLRAELDALASANVRLRDPAQEMASMMGQWVRPVLAARKRLLLVLPPAGAEEHPAWQLLRTMVPDMPVVHIENDLLRSGHGSIVSQRPLPAHRAVWKLDPNAAWRTVFQVPSRQASQSYTSLERQFNNPALAVLRDAAALRAGTMLSIAEWALVGTLAHRLVEKLFAQPGALDWQQAQVDAWFDANVPDLLQREGMPLLAPGRGMRLQQFKMTARSAIARLLELLRAAGAKTVRTEVSVSGQLATIALDGSIDLWVELPQGTATIDMKWARSKKYRERLVNGDFLQLAIYSHLAQQNKASPPVAVGYFTFIDATLTTTSPGVFPGARVVDPNGDVNVPQLLLSATASWDWRVQQWKAGDVELVCGPDDAQKPPAGCLPLRDISNQGSEYQVLYGQWEQA